MAKPRTSQKPRKPPTAQQTSKATKLGKTSSAGKTRATGKPVAQAKSAGKAQHSVAGKRKNARTAPESSSPKTAQPSKRGNRAEGTATTTARSSRARGANTANAFDELEFIPAGIEGLDEAEAAIAVTLTDDATAPDAATSETTMMDEALAKAVAAVAPRLPVVAIIGRPNVGKSTLFNRLIGERRSIVGDLPGITRDRIYGEVEWQDRMFRLVDTGGIVPDDEALIPANIFKQAQAAIDEAQVLLFVVDGREGVVPLDEELAQHLRALGKPVFVVANKAETNRVAQLAAEFYQFGFAEVYPVSAEHGAGIGDLLDALLDAVPTVAAETPMRDEIDVAIIGRPNVGKSSLINKLLGKERVIVSPIPGTTRDAVDSVFTAKDAQGQPIKLRVIDTAGIRRKGKTNEMAEKLSVVMARKHIERADVVLVIIDAIEGVTALDANIAGYAHEAGRSVIILVNKWDAVEKDGYTVYQYEEKIRNAMKFLDYAPILFISALTGQRVVKLPELIAKANAGRNLRIPTAQLNQFYADHLEQPKATTPSGSRVKVKYITQSNVRPPTFVIFTSSTQTKLHFSYERYLINRLRESFEFFATPIRVIQKNRKVKA